MNLDYSVDDAAFVTLGSNVATITNGNFNFALPAPAAGSHNLRLRSTSTGAISAATAFTTGAVGVPTNVSATPTAGNASVSVAMSATANGAAVTSFTVQRSTSASSGFADVGTQATASPPANGATSATFSDTGLTNDTTYYYRVVANTTAGNTTSPVATGVTPTSSMVAAPTHYYLSDANTRASNGNAQTPQASGGYIDMIGWVAPSDLTKDHEIFARWNNGQAADSTQILRVQADGKLFIAYVGASGGIKTYVSTASIPAFNASTGIWLRAQVNVSAVSVTPVAGSPVSPVPSINAVFSYAMPTNTNADSLTWTKLGDSVALTQTGFSQAQVPNRAGSRASDAPFIGRIFKLLVRDHNGTVLTNPDFTALATGITTFTDTASPNPLTWTVTSGAIK